MDDNESGRVHVQVNGKAIQLCNLNVPASNGDTGGRDRLMVILDENSSGVWVWDIAILENFPVDLDSFLSGDI